MRRYLASCVLLGLPLCSASSTARVVVGEVAQIALGDLVTESLPALPPDKVEISQQWLSATLQSDGQASSIDVAASQLRYNEHAWAGFRRSNMSGYQANVVDVGSRDPGLQQFKAVGSNHGEAYSIAHCPHYLATPCTLSFRLPVRTAHLNIANSAYTFWSMLRGDMFARRFTDGDWFEVWISGYIEGRYSGQVTVRLAAYEHGNATLMDEWTLVDLSDLGIVDKLEFAVESSDHGRFGMNTPAYFALRDITIGLAQDRRKLSTHPSGADVLPLHTRDIRRLQMCGYSPCHSHAPHSHSPHSHHPHHPHSPHSHHPHHPHTPHSHHPHHPHTPHS